MNIVYILMTLGRGSFASAVSAAFSEGITSVGKRTRVHDLDPQLDLQVKCNDYSKEASRMV
jgi:hypothetical protein